MPLPDVPAPVVPPADVLAPEVSAPDVPAFEALLPDVEPLGLAAPLDAEGLDAAPLVAVAPDEPLVPAAPV